MTPIDRVLPLLAKTRRRHSDHVARLQIRSGTPAAVAVVLVQKILNDVKALAKSEGATAFTLRAYTRHAPSDFDNDSIPF